MTATVARPEPGADWIQKAGAHRRRTLRTQYRKVAAAMELLILIAFFLILAAASAAGLTADSRDSADWKPSERGHRWRSHSY
jgi:hypothetical protein